MYSFGGRVSPGLLFKMVLKGAAVGLVVLVGLLYFASETPNQYSRSLVLMLFVFSFVLLTLWRMVGLGVLRRLKARGTAAENIAVLGTNGLSHQVAHALSRADGMAVNLVGFIAARPGESAGGNGKPVLGTVTELPGLINRYHIDRVMVTDPHLDETDLLLCAGTCQKMSVKLACVPDLVGLPSARLRFSRVEDLPVLEIDAEGLTSWQRHLKRLFDVVVVVGSAPIWLPVFALVWLLVRAERTGPAFYKSLRVGKGGRFFTFLKFRTMYVDAEERLARLRARNEKDGHLFKIKNDPRITKVGRILRRLSLDELPQLFNVLAGHMSLVGPRPLPVDTFEPDGESRLHPWWSSRRHSVLPGITGLWQVSGRSDLSFEEMVKLDLDYIERWSLLEDLKIMVRTAPAVLSASGAY